MIKPLIWMYFMEFHQNLLDICIFSAYLNVKIVYSTKLRDIKWTFVIHSCSLVSFSLCGRSFRGHFAKKWRLSNRVCLFPSNTGILSSLTSLYLFPVEVSLQVALGTLLHLSYFVSLMTLFRKKPLLLLLLSPPFSTRAPWSKEIPFWSRVVCTSKTQLVCPARIACFLDGSKKTSIRTLPITFFETTWPLRIRR